MPDVEYMLFCCRDLEHQCGFRVQAKTKEEAIELVKTFTIEDMDIDIEEKEESNNGNF